MFCKTPSIGRLCLAEVLSKTVALVCMFTVASPAQAQSVPANSPTFTISDIPLTGTEITTYTTNKSAARGNPVQVPIVFGAIAASYNLGGGPGNVLNIKSADFCGIFNGTITNYNQLTAPSTTTSANLPITVIVRSDTSGTTYALTSYLAKTCGAGYYLSAGVNTFPTTGPSASFIRASGSSGITNLIGATQGGLGYLEASFASPFRAKTPDDLNNAPTVARLQNAGDGTFIIPNTNAVRACANSLTTANLISDATYPSTVKTLSGVVSSPTPVIPSATGCYPITVPSYALAYNRYSTADQVNAVQSILNFILSNRQTIPTLGANDSITQSLGFALPSNQLRGTLRGIVNSITSP
jgi:phosphate transport system substrate-binding protein